MQTYGIYEAKTNFSKILTLVEHNEEVMISKAGKIVAKIVPYKNQIANKRVFGKMSGKIKVSDNFNDSLPNDILDNFYLGSL